MVDISAIVFNKNGDWHNVPYHAETYMLTIFYKKNTKKVDFNFSSNDNVEKMYVIIKYTKTTDISKNN